MTLSIELQNTYKTHNTHTNTHTNCKRVCICVTRTIRSQDEGETPEKLKFIGKDVR